MDLNSASAILLHQNIINNKPFLKKVYWNFYKRLKAVFPKKGVFVELGSGAGFIKEINPKIITSDVIDGPGIDKVFFAEKMPFKNSSVDVFLMLDVLHHIKSPIQAFKEFERCLKSGGKIVMIEPWNSLWGRFIYQNFHHEDFDPNGGWKVQGKGRMSNANGALPWIIFVKDRKLFEKRFPNLEIIVIEPHTPFSYLLSGGLSKSSLLPGSFYPTVNLLEKMFTPLNNWLSMFVTIELRKK